MIFEKIDRLDAVSDSLHKINTSTMIFNIYLSKPMDRGRTISPR